jgi:tetratricopeptide (TPR) repeat protein
MLFDDIEAHPQYVDPGIDRWSRGATRLRHAELLLRSGRADDAVSVLTAALAQQDMELRALGEQRSRTDAGERMRTDGDEAAIERNRGSILRLLNEEDAAENAFAKSLTIDEERLATEDAAAQAWTHFSLARTQLSMVNAQAARYEAAVATELTADRALATFIKSSLGHELDRGD